ncbi:MAG TPA: hypothetical protein VHE08_06270 [Solirubrobacterales bacterium]|nr:hypothetical protein [Solirubrobacterales bacterium]
MDTSVLWRSAAVQLGAVAALSIVLAILLPHSFFDAWGWVSGPLAWLLCAAFTARILDLPLGSTLLGALLAGLPSIVAVLIGAHWAGAVVAVALFALWCARLPARPVPAR